MPSFRGSAARQRILLTAHDLFYRDGVRATGIDRVIAESAVTKATFYRHFPSKNDLVRAFLDYRHRRWMAWFVEALQRHGGAPAAIVPALAEWFRGEGFRGCAFINSLGELAGSLPEVADITRRHKQDMTDAIAAVLPASRRRRQQADAVALAVDGANIRAQFNQSPDAALFIPTLYRYAALAGDDDCRVRARRMADWEIDSSCPAAACSPAPWAIRTSPRCSTPGR